MLSYYNQKKDGQSAITEAPSLSPAANTDLYEEFFQSKLISLRKQILEIDTDLEARQIIHEQVLKEIYHQVFSASQFLDQLKHWQIGYRVGVDMERNLWERQIALLTKEKRHETVSVWKDILSLREGKRELLKEYEELWKRLNFLR